MLLGSCINNKKKWKNSPERRLQKVSRIYMINVNAVSPFILRGTIIVFAFTDLFWARGSSKVWRRNSVGRSEIQLRPAEIAANGRDDYSAGKRASFRGVEDREDGAFWARRERENEAREGFRHRESAWTPSYLKASRVNPSLIFPPAN